MKEDTMKEGRSLNIYQRINAVMGDVSYIKKDDQTANGLPYKSVSHDAVIGKLNKPLQKHGIVITSDVVDINQNGNRTEIKLAVSFINIDDPNDMFTINFWGYGIDNQDKGIGKAVSYAMKYCLLKTFCLESGTNDDVESYNINYEAQPATVVIDYITNSQVQELELEINGNEDLRNKILQHIPGKSLSNLTIDRFQAVKNWINQSRGVVK